MAYTKTQWHTGDVITLEKMQKIEDGLEAASNSSLQNIKDGTGIGSIIEGDIGENIALGDFSHAEGSNVIYQYALTSSTDNKVYQVNISSPQSFVGNYIIGARAIITSDSNADINTAPIITKIQGSLVNNVMTYFMTFNKTLGSLDNTSVTFLLGAFGEASHIEGKDNLAHGTYAHAEGSYNTAYGGFSHVEGSRNEALGSGSHAEGLYNYAEGSNSHVEGNYNRTTKSASHAEGSSTRATGEHSHSEGEETQAIGDNSHAEGYYNVANGAQSHAEGSYTQANGTNSHAEGSETKASGMNQHVIGKCNIEDANSEYVEIVGNGSNPWQGSNARTLDWSGNESLAGSLTLGMGTNDEVTITAAQLKQLLALLN